MMIKLSEFGLCKFGDRFDDSQVESNDQDGNSFPRAAKRLKYTKKQGEQQDICLRKYWILDGTTDSNQQTPTPNQDIFSVGCICFYFLTRGVHPFGYDAPSILENIKKQNPVNLLKSNSFVYNINENK
jgi:serine/threonine protein kinase